MNEMTIGIGEIGFSNNRKRVLKTFALGSCLAVIIWDAVAKFGAMAHITLPDSSNAIDKNLEMSGKYADTAIPYLFNEMKKYNPLMNKRNLVVKLVGSAEILNDGKLFQIGKRNLCAVKELLKNEGVSVTTEDVGGSVSRTVSLNINSGVVTVYNPGIGEWKI